ncbi:MAG: hypothetical protein J6Y16_04135, partial [Treponema sp.]|nr:hypothetical protein [Treponema sp.]
SDEEDYSYEEAPAQPYRTGRLNPHNLAASKEPSISDLNFDALIQNADDMAETPSKVESTRKETVAKPTAAPKDDFSFDIDDANADFETDASLDLNETIPEEFQEHPAPEFVDMDFDKKETVPAEEKAAPEMDLPDFDVEDEFDNAPEAAAKTEQEGEEDEGGSFSMDDMDLPDFSDTDGSPAADSSEDLDNAESTFLDGSETPPEDAPAEENNDEPLETYDISAMEDMDFSAPGVVKDNSDFDMGDVDGMEMSDDDFEIPNFTTTEKDPFSSFSSKKASVSTPDFKEALEDEGKGKPKNSFTDAEYKRFRKNLSEYPLNVRIAIEDLVVKNEFTDDAVFEILEKVYRKIPARQLATQLEKMLDISLDVPRDYERRTAEEYENYKSTLEYKIKNKIIPFAVLGAFAAIVIFCLFTLFVAFIWNPFRANTFYKQGYSQIQENLYTQSEDSFKSAIRYKPVRKWFFKFAEAYRDHKQYERARNVYKEALYQFDRDKWAGIDWADMEMS